MADKKLTLLHNYSRELSFVEGAEDMIKYWRFYLRIKDSPRWEEQVAAAKKNLKIAVGNTRCGVSQELIVSCWGQFECDMRLLGAALGEDHDFQYAKKRVVVLQKKVQRFWERDEGWEECFDRDELFHVFECVRQYVESPRCKYRHVHDTCYNEKRTRDLKNKCEDDYPGGRWRPGVRPNMPPVPPKVNLEQGLALPPTVVQIGAPKNIPPELEEFHADLVRQINEPRPPKIRDYPYTRTDWFLGVATLAGCVASGIFVGVWGVVGVLFLSFVLFAAGVKR